MPHTIYSRRPFIQILSCFLILTYNLVYCDHHPNVPLLLEKLPTPNFITFHIFSKLSMSYSVLNTSPFLTWNKLVILLNSYYPKMIPPYLDHCNYSISRLSSQIHPSQKKSSFWNSYPEDITSMLQVLQQYSLMISSPLIYP